MRTTKKFMIEEIVREWCRCSDTPAIKEYRNKHFNQLSNYLSKQNSKYNIETLFCLIFGKDDDVSFTVALYTKNKFLTPEEKKKEKYKVISCIYRQSNKVPKNI